MWAEYGLDWPDAIRVVISSIVFFGVVNLMVRVLGQRTLMSLSSFDLAAVIALGALIGRAILGDSPTLLGGLLGVGTLLVLQALSGQARRVKAGARLVNSPALVLMAGPNLILDNLNRSHIIADEIWARLRLAGIRDRSEVACVILESTGQISVLRAGQPIERTLLNGVRGADRIPAEFLTD